MAPLWTCPHCSRTFRQINQAHSCGVGSRNALLDGKPEALVKLYQALEKTWKSKRDVEIVYRGRYVLFRTTRIFADLVFMRDALRLAIFLDREVKDEPLFFKVQWMSTHRAGHVAKLRTAADLRQVAQYVNEAYELARSEPVRDA